jgi:hypothetical protein
MRRERVSKNKVTKIRRVNKFLVAAITVAVVGVAFASYEYWQIGRISESRTASEGIEASVRERSAARVSALLADGKREEAMNYSKYWYWRSSYAIASELFDMANKFDVAEYGASSEEALSSQLWEGLALTNAQQYSTGARLLQDFVDKRTQYLRGSSSAHAENVSELYGGGYAGMSVKQARLKVQYGISRPLDTFALQEINDTLTVLTFEKEYDRPDRFGQQALDYSAYDYDAGEDPWNY